MSKNSLLILAFGLFALGLPLYGMKTNDVGGGNGNTCVGECYEQWRDETGGVVAIAAAAAAAKAEASPEELGKQGYAGCIACHGAGGEGGVGPALAGTSVDMIVESLTQYRAGDTRGAQSALMWSQSAALSDPDIDNIAAFVESL